MRKHSEAQLEEINNNSLNDNGDWQVDGDTSGSRNESEDFIDSAKCKTIISTQNSDQI